MSRWNFFFPLVAVVVAAVNGLIKCTSCFLRQQFQSEERGPVYGSLVYSFSLCSYLLHFLLLPPKQFEVVIFPNSFWFPGSAVKLLFNITLVLSAS